MSNMVAWLRSTLDELETSAKHAHRRGCDTLSNFLYATGMSDTPIHEECDCDGPRSVLARVEAERRVVAAYEEQVEYHGDPEGVIAARIAVEWLAYGHRHDAEGYDPAWTPEGVTA